MSSRHIERVYKAIEYDDLEMYKQLMEGCSASLRIINKCVECSSFKILDYIESDPEYSQSMPVYFNIIESALEVDNIEVFLKYLVLLGGRISTLYALDLYRIYGKMDERQKKYMLSVCLIFPYKTDTVKKFVEDCIRGEHG